ncbi:MAG: beta strand repeat-containing protein [Terriglobales bacterium]
MPRRESSSTWLPNQGLALVCLVLIALFCSTLAYAADPGAPAATPAAPRLSKAEAAQRLALLPLSFEPNVGQSDARAKFVSRGSGYMLFLTPSETVLNLSHGNESNVLRLKYVGAKAAPQMRGEESLALKTFYYLGNDPAKWHKNVPNFRRVRYQSLYKGIDLAFYGNQGQLENDFLVAAGADPSRIRWEVTGARHIATDAAGDLVLSTAAGDVRMLKPRAWQDINGQRKDVAVSYQLVGNHIGFEIAPYDRSLPLVIDPVIQYMSYIAANPGTTSPSFVVSGVAVNGATAYVTGWTTASAFPAPSPAASANCGNAGGNSCGTKGSDDAFLLALPVDGSSSTPSMLIIFGAASSDKPAAVAIGAAGSIYVAGSTAGAGFPIPVASDFVAPQSANAGGTDGFMAKFDSTGNLVYSTLVGGAGNDGINGIYVVSPYAYLIGTTASSDLPTVNAAQSAQSAGSGGTDAFVAVVNTSAGAAVTGYTCASPANTLKVVLTAASPFAVNELVNIAGTQGGKANLTNGKISSITTTTITNDTLNFTSGVSCGNGSTSTNNAGHVTGGQRYDTYLGGSSSTVGNGIVATGVGAIWVAGSTNAVNFPNTNGLQSAIGGGTNAHSDAFVTNIDTNQTTTATIVNSTYVGGAEDDFGNAIALDDPASPNFVYIAGTTSSLVADTAWLCSGTHACTLQTAPVGSQSAFVAALPLNLQTKVNWGTFLSGSGADQGNAIKADASNVYLGGTTQSTDIFGANPVLGSLQGTVGPFNSVSQKPQDGFVAIISGSKAATQTLAQGIYLGAAGNNDSVVSLAVSGTAPAQIYAVGNTDSPDLWSAVPSTTIDAYQPTGPLVGTNQESAATLANAGTTTAGFVTRIDYSGTASTLTATESISNNTPGQPTSSTIVGFDTAASTPHARSIVTYTYTLSAANANATDVVFNWPMPRQGYGLSIVIDAGGTGYTGAPSVTIPPPDLPGGVQAVAGTIAKTVNVLNLGPTPMTTVGNGYSTAPAVSITGGSGSNATAHAVLIPPTTPALMTTVTAASNGSGGTCKDVAGVGAICRYPSITTGNPVTATVTATLTTQAAITSGTLPITQRPTAGAANSAVTSITTTPLTDVPVVDLTITMPTTPPNNTLVGAQLNPAYKLVIANSGPSDAPTVSVVDTLPLGFHPTYNTGGNVGAQPVTHNTTTTLATWTCSLTQADSGTPPNTVPAIVTCSNNPGNSLTNGTSVDILIPGLFDPAETDTASNNGCAGCAVVSNTADVNKTNVPTDSINRNTTTNTVTVGALTIKGNIADLKVTQVAAPLPPATANLGSGSNVTYTITPTNQNVANGKTVQNVQVLDTFPKGFHYTSVSSIKLNNVEVGPSAGTVKWNCKVNTADTGSLSNDVNGNLSSAGVAAGVVQCMNDSVGDGTGTVTPFAVNDSAVIVLNGFFVTGETYTSGVADPTVPSVACSGGPTGCVTTTNTVTIADVSAIPNGDPNTADNTDATGAVDVTRVSDLKITLDGSNNPTLSDNSTLAVPVSLAGPLTINAPITNSGGDDAYSVLADFALQLIPGATFTQANVASTGCTAGSTSLDGSNNVLVTVTCHLGTTADKLANAGQATVPLSLTPAANWLVAGTSQGTVLTTATVRSPSVKDNGGSGGVGANNTSQQKTSFVARKADVEIHSQSLLASNATTVGTNDFNGGTKIGHPVGIKGTLILAALVQNKSGDSAAGVQVKFTLPTSGFANLADANWAAFTGNSGGNPSAFLNGLFGTTGVPLKVFSISNAFSCSAVGADVTCNVPDADMTSGSSGIYGIAVTPTDATLLNNANSPGSWSQKTNTVAVQSTTTMNTATLNTSQQPVSTFASVADLQFSYTDNTQGGGNAKPLTYDPSNAAKAGPGLILSATLTNNGPDSVPVDGNLVVKFTLTGGTDPNYTINTLANQAADYFPGGCSKNGGNALEIDCVVGPDATNFPSGFMAKAGSHTYTVNIIPSTAWITSTAKTGAIGSTAVGSAGLIWDDSANNDGTAGTNNNGSLTSNFQRTSDLLVTTAVDNTNGGAISMCTKVGVPTTGCAVGAANILTIVANVQNNGPDPVPADTTTHNGSRVTFTFPTPQVAAATISSPAGIGGTVNGVNGVTALTNCTATNNHTVACDVPTPNPFPVSNTPAPYGLQVTIVPDTGWVGALQSSNTTSNPVSVAAANAAAPKVENAATLSTNLERLADLAISSPSTNGTVASTSPVTISASINNSGPDAIPHLKVTFWASNLTSAWTVNTAGCGTNPSIDTNTVGYVTCDFGALAAGAGNTFTLSMTPPSNLIGASANPPQVQLLFTEYLSDVTANTVACCSEPSVILGASIHQQGPILSTVQRQSKLGFGAIAADTTKAAPYPGGTLTLKTDHINTGPDNAPGVIVQYSFPQISTFTTVKSTTYPGGCTQSGAGTTVTCFIDSQTVIGSGTQLLGNSIPVSYAVELNVDPAFTTGGQNSALAPVQVQIGTQNNTCCTFNLNANSGNFTLFNGGNPLFVNIFRGPVINLSVLSHDSYVGTGNLTTKALTATLGTTVNYKIVVQNAGMTGALANPASTQTNAATGVTLDEILPAAFTNPQVDAGNSTAGWSCNFASHPTCSFANPIISGGSATLVITGNYADTPAVNALLNSTPGKGTASISAVVAPGVTNFNPDIIVPSPATTPLERMVVLSGKVTTTNTPPISGAFYTLGDGTPQYPNAVVNYKVEVDNASTGPDPNGGPATPTNAAYGIGMTFAVPANFIVDPASIGTSPGWSCSPIVAGANVSCSLSDNNPIPSSGSSSVLFSGQYNQDPTITNTSLQCGNLTPATGCATIPLSNVPSTTESFQGNGSIATTPANVTVQRLVALNVPQYTGSSGASFANLGSNVLYTLLVANNPLDANNVRTNPAAVVSVKVSLPSNFQGSGVNGSFTTNDYNAGAGWSCDFTGVPGGNGATCTSTLPGGIGSGASQTLTISGSYANALSLSTMNNGGQKTYPVAAQVAASLSAGTGLPLSPTAVSTNVQRAVNLGLVAFPQGSVSLTQQFTYELDASNLGSAGLLTPNDADVSTVVFHIPDKFDPVGSAVPTDAANNFSCLGWVPALVAGQSGQMCSNSGNGCDSTCTSKTNPADLGISSGNTFQLKVLGQFDSSLSSNTGSTPTLASGTLTSPLSFNAAGQPVTASSNLIVNRDVNLTVQMGVAPSPAAASCNPATASCPTTTITYTFTTVNSGPDAVAAGAHVDFTLPPNFTISPQGGGALGTCSPTACSSCTLNGNVLTCAYPSQAVGAQNAETVTVKGTFATVAVSQTGFAGANASALVDVGNLPGSNNPNSGAINHSTNQQAFNSVTVVDTPVGANITPELSSNRTPLLVTYQGVTQAGVTLQNGPLSAVQIPPGLTPVAISGYNTGSFFSVQSGDNNGQAQVGQTGTQKVCVFYSSLATAFTKPERARIFNALTSADITATTGADLANNVVCGTTSSIAAAPGSLFTVRDAANHLPVVQNSVGVPNTFTVAADTTGAKGLVTTNFFLDAAGVLDADLYQPGVPPGSNTFCPALVTSGAPDAQHACSDLITLTFTWSDNQGNHSTTIGPIGPDPATHQYCPLSSTRCRTGSILFNLGRTPVHLVVTDETGVVGTSNVGDAFVSVNTTALTTNVTAATILAGQSTTFVVKSPPDAVWQTLGNVAIVLTCGGFKVSDGSSLAANHVNCTVSPNSITQGLSANVLLTTAGPNFSQVRPPRPGSGRGVLAMWFGLATLPAFGMLLLPGVRRKRSRWFFLFLIGGLLVAMLACGGGGGTQPAAQTVSTVTPSGVYTITVSGSVNGSVVAQSFPTYTLTVQ